jgi:hypothetical protein
VQVQYPKGSVGIAVGAKHEARKRHTVWQRRRYAFGVRGPCGQEVIAADRGRKHQFVFVGFEPDQRQCHYDYHRAGADEDDPRQAPDHQCQLPTASRAA